MLILHDPVDASVDIVFIHGLNGDLIKTWSLGEVCWPRDLLKDDIPTARILTFGYDAQIIHFWVEPSQSRIDTHADALFADLVAIRTKTKTTERSIIFVAHSLGGLVCAQALLLANNSPDHVKAIAKCTRYIAFLGTPHAGSSKAAWGEAGRRFITYLGISTNKELVKNLDLNSEVLSRLGRDFPMLLESRLRASEEIEVMCFFEGRKFKVCPTRIDKIVPEESACLAGKPRLSINADHSEMCKYDGNDDQSYIEVVGVLSRWAEKAVNQKDKKYDEGAKTINNVAANFTNATNNGGLMAGQVTGNTQITTGTMNSNRDPPQSASRLC